MGAKEILFAISSHYIRLNWYCKGVKRRIFTLNIENWHVLDGGHKKTYHKVFMDASPPHCSQFLQKSSFCQHWAPFSVQLCGWMGGAVLFTGPDVEY